MKNRAVLLPIIALVLFLFSGNAGFCLDLALITAEDLSGGMGKWVILDARPVKEWAKGHIPGSISFSWEAYTETDQDGVKYRTWPPERLCRALGDLGVCEKTPVVVYGDADSSWGGEGWAVWVLAWLGHAGPVRLLDGGIQAWEKSGHPLSRESETKRREPVNYVPSVDPEVTISADEIARDPGRYAIVDVRSLMEWLTGRLPGAVRIDWGKFFEGPLRRPLRTEAVKGILEKNGVPAGKTIVFYCTGGIRSGYAWAVARLAGIGDVKNFEGGTEEWEWWNKRNNP